MVTILPSGNSYLDVIGQAAGQTSGSIMGQVMPQIMQQQYSQNMLQKGLGELEGISPEQLNSMNPLQLLAKVSKPFAGIPGGADLAAKAYSELIKMRGMGDIGKGGDFMSALNSLNGNKQSGDASKFLWGMGQQDQGGMGQQQPGSIPQQMQTSEDIKPTPKGERSPQQIAQHYLEQMRPDIQKKQSNFAKIPRFKPSGGMSLSADDEFKIRQKMSKDGIRPESQQPIIDIIKADAERQWKENVQQYAYDKETQAWIDKKWKEVESYATPQIDNLVADYTDPIQDFVRNRFYEHASEQDPNLTPQQITDRARTLLRGDLELVNPLKALPALDAIRSPEDIQKNIERYNRAYAPLKKLGMRELIYQDLTGSKDAGPEEAALITYGDMMSPQTTKAFDKIDKLTDEERIKLSDLNNLKSIPGSGFLPNSMKYDKSIDAKVNKMEQQVFDAVMASKDDDNLMVMKSWARSKGLPEQKFSDIVNRAINSGKKFSKFQENQISQVNTPSQHSLSRIFYPDEWERASNYLRGKR